MPGGAALARAYGMAVFFTPGGAALARAYGMAVFLCPAALPLRGPTV